MSGDDYYSFLGVSRDATQEDIKHAYRILAIKLHPDTSDNKDGELFKKLLMIYAVLSDPNQRHAYDEGSAYAYYTEEKKASKQPWTSSHKTSSSQEKPENYSSAVFVNGIQARDSSGSVSYVRLEDYIYYPVSAKKKFFFFRYTAGDYYRVRVSKIYSRKRNSFRKVPLFVVNFDDLEQVIFEGDFGKYWLSEQGFHNKERQQAVLTFSVEIALLVFVTYLLLQMK